MRYLRYFRLRYVYAGIAIAIGLIIAYTDFGQRLLELGWLLFGLLFAWILQSVYAYFYIRRLELRLGRPVFEKMVA